MKKPKTSISLCKSMPENAQQQEQPVAESAAPISVTEPDIKNTADIKSSTVNMESQKEKPPSPPPANEIVSGILSIFSFVLSLALLAYAVWLFYMRAYDCEDILGLQSVQTWVSIGLIALFVLSNVALFLRRRLPMPVMVVMVVSLILTLFMGLAYVGVNEMQSGAIPATPMWFKHKIRDDVNWNNIKSCIFDTHACMDLVLKSFKEKSYGLNMIKMSAIESGCCKPPSTCAMQYLNATYWRRKDPQEELETDYHDRDCDLWRNERTVLCYDCRACKAGFMRALRRKWWQLGVFFIVMSVLLLLCHFLLFLATFWERYKG